MKVVYIASPYTKGDKETNVRRQLCVSNTLMGMGFCPIAPLLTHYQHLLFPRTYEEWMKVDFEKVRRSDAVLRLEGESEGADREVDFARKHSIPVVYSISELAALFTSKISTQKFPLDTDCCSWSE